MTRFRLVLLLCGAIAVGAILGTTRARATICAYSENLAGYADGELCLTGGGSMNACKPPVPVCYGQYCIREEQCEGWGYACVAGGQYCYIFQICDPAAACSNY
jgi:hypothetical protein